ncbi:DDE family transposase [Mucilaginibacter gracilis]|uniref:DDE family transposase n=1 Tax=Mucilaginibacter gracilis TaxID=423350 RepID=A0A495JA43_9SPHI|nr:IS982 family transposase [Mucilaginibacter gracilis]RKR80797.1 DDE family transposase [Mucilaginibacter gracilis]RKR81791.1 DDE family transposase [Mucilaginibacter gracilis]RKR81928.1 DDE family transposase [Mucilaginibacter gracilis]RKR82052.1 DDE family transposase [Mucilaginibacter gracilis]RKR82493.1 DDE family transposase [Mucilaginibacter gracilis]
MNNLIQNYTFILEEFRKLSIKEDFYYKPVRPRLSDLELITLNLTAEYCGIDSEYQLFRNLKGTPLDILIERSVYNKRKRKLFPHINEVRKKLVQKLNAVQDCFIVDSMPLEVCKNARAARSKICKEQEYAFPNHGFCAAQSSRYYGYKLHAVCSVDGVFENFDLSPASVHDIHYLKDIQQQMTDCVLLGDKGYLSAEVQVNLFESVNIRLETPMRNNQKKFKPYPYLFKKSRKRIETLFSQLCDQFMIRRNYAKTFEGFKTRTLSKITALTTIQYLNKFIFKRNMNHIKINLV